MRKATEGSLRAAEAIVQNDLFDEDDIAVVLDQMLPLGSVMGLVHQMRARLIKHPEHQQFVKAILDPYLEEIGHGIS